MPLLIVNVDEQLAHDELEGEVDDAENILLLKVLRLEAPHLFLKLFHSSRWGTLNDLECVRELIFDFIGARFKTQVLDEIFLCHQNYVSKLGEILDDVPCVVFFSVKELARVAAEHIVVTNKFLQDRVYDAREILRRVL